MAINYTISYTFSPNTTISSSNVNTNFSDNANTWTGLEAKTKSFSALQVDATPTASTDVAIKSYVDKLNAYRRPNLQYNSGTVINVETGLDGTSGDCTIVFPDGTKRTDTATGRIQCNLAQVAALSGSWQSGIRTGTVANNTWYSLYAVKTTDDTAKFVIVADTVIPVQANYATLNSNFGTSGWVYLGLVAYGNNNDVANAVVKFVQVGHTTFFYNTTVGQVFTCTGVTLAATASAATLTWTYAAGTSIASAGLPSHVSIVYVQCDTAAVATTFIVEDSTNSIRLAFYSDASIKILTPKFMTVASLGIKTSNGTSTAKAQDILLNGFVDGVLGIGANPVL